MVGASVVGGALSSRAQRKAANAAANAQIEASERGVEEQRRQFDAVQKLLKPYADAGLSGLSGQQDLLGINGTAAQQAAIGNINNSAEMQTYLQQGENAILQNASATGGLRGGNTQAALAQFRPQLLNQLINQRYQNLAGMTALGQNAAAGTGNAGMQTASNISNLYQQTGAAQAGAALANGQASANMWNGVSSTIGTLGGMKLMGMF
ncbi:hypothetical protein DC346_01865 [Acinetobacter junii]|uniref:DNA transfer protein n=2 Tax=Moraxellaceae TaxID=468 RepID=A0A365PMJ7_ACIJU|nr:hypothetical protein DDF86_00240 [Acinetobacter junii]RBA42953.1 hypothetical protein DDG62_01485 [Acinetobacter junii]RBA49858.1 hypothetical protein DC346_01865 [Acinetobacter junii]